MKQKTAKIQLDSIKDPDGWGALIDEIGLTEAKARKFFEWSEYASLELEFDQDLNVVSGRVIPLGRRR